MQYSLSSIIFNYPFLKQFTRRRINSYLDTLNMMGILSSLRSKWDGKGGNCPDPYGNSLPVRRPDSGVTALPLTPQDLAVPLLWLFLCGLITGGVAALEISYTKGYLDVSVTKKMRISQLHECV